MIVIRTHEDLEQYYDGYIYVFPDDIFLTFDIKIEGSIVAKDIQGYKNISAFNITAKKIYASDIKADSLQCVELQCDDIIVNNIRAKKINYNSVCVARNSFECETVKGDNKNSMHKCLNQDIKKTKIPAKYDMEYEIAKLFVCYKTKDNRFFLTTKEHDKKIEITEEQYNAFSSCTNSI